MTSPASSRSDARSAACLEPIEAAHASALEALFVANDVKEVTASFDPFPLSRERARTIAMQPRRDSYYALVEGSELLGMSMLRGADDGYEVPSFGIFVDRRHQGRGLGRLLTELTLEQARRQGAPAVRLSVYADNVAARRLYESLGFAEAERDAGEGHAKIVMKLALVQPR
jgi:ribosomal protein S18 acetylase RimI-like enzyme